jgi:ribonuclease VapC
MTAYLLDTSALLTLRDDEPGADRVADLLEQAQRGEARCLGGFMTLMEILYRVWRDEGEAAGRLAMSMHGYRLRGFASRRLIETSGRVKRNAFTFSPMPGLPCALNGAVLIHKDPGFNGGREQEALLPKPKRSKLKGIRVVSLRDPEGFSSALEHRELSDFDEGQGI